ncbi:MAG: nucleoside triphosphate pyrophosphohydrolase, partial [Dehalococcoidia bacterium]
TFAELVETMRRLRDPQGGCPWDLQQTHESLRDTLLEESYETLEALVSGNTSDLVEELGDLLLQVLFHARIGEDDGRFTLADIIAHLNEKLVRRHPHVFGDQAASTAAEAIGQWEKLKAAERESKGQGERSMLAGVPKTMPALAYAQAVQGRAVRAGFDWDAPDAVLDKVAEELAELREETAAARREEEFGDLLFAMVGAAHRMGVQTEEALRGANARFSQRFGRVEAAVRRQGIRLADLPEAEKLALWAQAKAEEEG